MSHAFHSPLMKPMENDFKEFLSTLKFAPLRVPLASTVTGNLVIPGEQIQVDHWITQLAGSVLFSDTLVKGLTLGENNSDKLDSLSRVEAIVEIGPGPVLTRMSKLWVQSAVFKKKPVVWACAIDKFSQTMEKATKSFEQVLNVIKTTKTVGKFNKGVAVSTTLSSHNVQNMHSSGSELKPHFTAANCKTKSTTDAVSSAPANISSKSLDHNTTEAHYSSKTLLADAVLQGHNASEEEKGYGSPPDLKLPSLLSNFSGEKAVNGQGKSAPIKEHPVFFFSGLGSNWDGMGCVPDPIYQITMARCKHQQNHYKEKLSLQSIDL